MPSVAPPSPEAEDSRPVRVLVSTHKPAASFDCAALEPIQVGAALASQRLPGMLHDDEGDNRSSQNKLLCELTAQYWAWRNVDSEYVGFCHYRRYFNFSGQRYPENPWGEVIEPRLTPKAQEKYGLTAEAIEAAVEGWDVLHSPIQDLAAMPGDFSTPLEQYAAAPKLRVEDLELCGRVVKELHPDYAEDVDAYLSGPSSCFCNMYVMRTELFRAYASWLFPILDRCMDEIDLSHTSVETLRTPGHLAERLFNIWLVHQKLVNPQLKAKELQVVHFEDTEPPAVVEPHPPGSSAVPVVFAANDAYVPMVSTALVSVLEHASRDRAYDLFVLHQDVSPENQRAVEELVARYPQARLRFIDVSGLVESHSLTTNNPHISAETYYRFLIQDLLPYDKALYLDSDLVVRADVAELFDQDVDGKLLGAVLDTDFLGNLNHKDGERLAYNRGVLGMKDPYGYFQAGVLVMNLAEMRQFMSLEEWLQVASNPDYIYNDQDALNACCEGRVAYLDQRWNVMNDFANRVEGVFSFAPAEVYEGYLQARRDPWVVHYAGPEKPWNSPSCDLARYYWEAARVTPQYEAQLVTLSQAGESRLLKAVRRPRAAVSQAVRSVVDPLLPVGSPQREFVKGLLGRSGAQ